MNDSNISFEVFILRLIWIRVSCPVLYDVKLDIVLYDVKLDSVMIPDRDDAISVFQVLVNILLLLL